MTQTKLFKLLQKTITALMCFWLLSTQMPINVVFADEINTEENIVEDINENEINNIDNEEEDQIIIEEDVETVNKEEDEIVDNEIIEEVETETSINQELLDRVNTLLNTDITSITDIDELTNVHDNTNNIIDEYNELSSDEQINIDYDSLLSFKYDVTKLLIDRLVDSLPSEDEINTFDDVQKQIAPTRKLVRSTIPNLISELNEEDQTNYNNNYASLLSDITTLLANRQKQIMNGEAVGALIYDAGDGTTRTWSPYSTASTHRNGTLYLDKDCIQTVSIDLNGDLYLDLRGHTLTFHSTSNQGSAIDLNGGNGFDFILFDSVGGGKFTTDTPSYYHRAVYILSDAEFTMYGGTITGFCNTNYDGGAVYIDSNVAGFRMEGGTITGNKAKNGGAIYSNNGQYVKLNGGTIYGNESTANGGAIRLNNGSFTLNGGEIGKNTGANGRGIYTGVCSYNLIKGLLSRYNDYYNIVIDQQRLITLDKQSGTGGTDTSETYVIISKNESMPKIVPPSRTGYTFGGYYSSTNGYGTKYYNADGTSANNWISTTGGTLYAKWTANRYTVTLNNQSATTAGSASVTATYDSAMPIINVPTRIGYVFDGYYSGTNGSGTKYYNADGSSAHVWDKTSNTTLYANWVDPVTKYAAKVNSNIADAYYDGEESYFTTFEAAMLAIKTNSLSNVTVTLLDNAQLTNSLDSTNSLFNNLTIDLNGKTITGKKDKNIITNNDFTEESSLTIKNGNVISGSTGYCHIFGGRGPVIKVTSNNVNYYANAAINKATSLALGNIIVEFNGGYIDPKLNVEWQYIDNLQADVSLKGDIYYPGTRFIYYDGVTTQNSRTIIYGGKYVNDPTSYVPNGYVVKDINEQKDEYTYKYQVVPGGNLTLNENGGSYASGYSEPIKYEASNGLTLPTATQITKTGYTFKGWYVDSNFSGSAVASIAINTTGDKTYYAKWEANTNTAYKVEHYKQNSDCSTYSTTATETENKIGTTGENVTPDVKTYTGYTSPSTQTKEILADGSTVVDYYYTRNKYDISYVLDGGSFGINHPENAIWDVSFVVDNPTKTGYTFAGWNITGMDSNTHTYGSDTTTNTSIDKTTATEFNNLNATNNSTVTFTATWINNQYTVTLDAQGGTPNTSTITATYDLDMPQTSIPTKAGYSFVGYFDKVDGGTQYYKADGTSAKNWDKIVAEATLYANWKINTESENWQARIKSSETLSKGEECIINNETYYYFSDFKEALTSAQDNQTVEFLRDINYTPINIGEIQSIENSIIVDFCGHSFNIDNTNDKPTIYINNDIVFKNGTIKRSPAGTQHTINIYNNPDTNPRCVKFENVNIDSDLVVWADQSNVYVTYDGGNYNIGKLMDLTSQQMYVNIVEGNFNFDQWFKDNSETGHIIITGGNFTKGSYTLKNNGTDKKSVSDYCDNGYVVVANTDATTSSKYPFSAVEGYEITFDSNGGKWNDNYNAPNQYLINGGLSYTSSTVDTIETVTNIDFDTVGNNVSKEGYSFVEWNTQADGQGTSYAPGATYSLNENVKLYAIWESSYATVIRGREVTGADYYDGTDSYFTSLHGAFNKAENNDTIDLLRDIASEEETWEQNIKKEIVLNLNSHSIFKENTSNILRIYTSTTINGPGIIDYEININNGNVTLNDLTTTKSINVGYQNNICTLNLNRINSDKVGTSQGAKINAQGKTTVNVVDGTIRNLYCVDPNTSDIYFNISGEPYFNGGETGSCNFNKVPVNNVIITGGNFDWQVSNIIYTENQSKPEINPYNIQWLKDCYRCYCEGNRYIVREYYEATINNNKYQTLLDAYIASKDGDTIKIEKDCNFAAELEVKNNKQPLTISKNITIDTNGYRIFYTNNEYEYHIITIADDVKFTGNGFVEANILVNNSGKLLIDNGTYKKTILNDGGELKLIKGLFYQDGIFSYSGNEKEINDLETYKIKMLPFVEKNTSHLRVDNDHLVVEPHHFVNHYCDTIIDGEECGAIDHDSVVAEVFNSNEVLVGQYFALKDAVTAAKTGDTVKLLRDITLDQNTKIYNVTFADGIIIDLNGKSIIIEAKSGSPFESLTNKFIIKNGNIVNNNTTGYSAFFNCAEVTAYDINFTAPNINGSGEYAQITAYGTKIHLYGGSVGDNVVINHDGGDEITIDNNGNNKFKYKETQLSINTSEKITINSGLFNADINSYLDNNHVVINSTEQGYQYEVVEGGKITFETNGGSLENPIITQYITANGIELPTPTKDNYIFDGWYTDSDLSTKVTNTTSFGKDEKGSKTLYAKWLEPVASINSNNVTTLYASLQEALSAAKPNETVTLLKNVTVNATQEDPEEIPADVTLTFADANAVLVNKGVLNIKGTIQLISSGKCLYNDTTGTLTIENGGSLNSTNGDMDLIQVGKLVVKAGATHILHVPNDVDNGYAFGPEGTGAWTELTCGKVVQELKVPFDGNPDNLLQTLMAGYNYTFDKDGDEPVKATIRYELHNNDEFILKNGKYDLKEIKEFENGTLTLGEGASLVFNVYEKEGLVSTLISTSQKDTTNFVVDSSLENKKIVEIENIDDEGKTSYTYTLKDLIRISIPEAISNLKYNGLEQTGVAEGTGYRLNNNKGTDPGEYTAIATLEDDYIWSDNSLTNKNIEFNIEEADFVFANISFEKTTYNNEYQGSNNIVNVQTVDGCDYEIKYKDNNGNYTLTSAPTFIDAGKYDVYYQITAPKHKTVTGKYVVEIEPLSISNAEITLGEYDMNYCGTPIEPSVVSVKVGDITLDSTDYEVIYSNNELTDATVDYSYNEKDAIAKVTAKENTNFTGYIEVTYKIQRKTYTVTWNLNDGHLEAGVLPTIKYYGKAITIAYLPKKEGYRFVNYVDQDDTKYENGNQIIANKDLVLDAIYEVDPYSDYWVARVDNVINETSGVKGKDNSYYFTSLTAALNEAVENLTNEEAQNSTVTLLKDVELVGPIQQVPNNVIIDLNNKKISSATYTDNSVSNDIKDAARIFYQVENSFSIKNGTLENRALCGYAIFTDCKDVKAYDINYTYTQHNNSSYTDPAQIAAYKTTLEIYGGSVEGNYVLTWTTSEETITINNSDKNKFFYKCTNYVKGGSPSITINGGLYKTLPLSTYVNDEHVVIDTVGNDKTNGYNYEVVEGGKITFTLNDGTLPSGYSNPTIYTKESGISLPIPTRNEYVFDGWYTDSDLKTSVTNTTSFGQGETGPKTLYAKWITVIEAAVAKIESNDRLTHAVGFENGYSYYDTLANAIKDATSAETKITLLKDIAEHDLTISANQNVTLDLNRKTIDAENKGRLFVINGSLTINDSTATGDETNGTYVAGRLINGRSTGSGTVGTKDSELGNAIFVKGENAALNINDGIIENCTMIAGKGSGNGTIYATGDNSEVRFNGGVIRNCTTLKGGAFYIAGSYFKMTGGAIINCKSTYVGSQTEGAGAINLFCNTSLITGGLISGCEAAGKCGGIQIKIAKLTITGGVFENCTGGDVTRGQLIDVINDDQNRYLLKDELTGIRGSSLEITGGTFVGADNAKTNDLIHISSNDENKITGGWYSGDITPNENYGVVGPINDAPDARAPYTVTNNFYTITYNSNGGSTIDPEKIYSLPGHSVETTIMNEVPTKDYETFIGWNTMADGTGTRYVAGDVITLTGSITLYAQWQEQKVKVELHSKALISGNSISSVGQLSGGGNNIVKGKMHLITAESNDTYQFDHWDINGVIKEDANLNYVFTEDTVVYAIYRYEPSKGIHVNIEAEKPFTVKTLEKKSWLVWDYYEDGIYVAENINGKYDVNIKVVAGSQIELIYDNTNNDFSGWVSGYGSIVSKNPKFIMHEIYVETDLRLETNKKVKEYYAEFIGYGNQIIKADNFESLEELKALANTAMAAPSSGYTFIGWKIDETLLNDITSIDDLSFENDGTTVKLLPKYEKIESKKTITISSYIDGEKYKDDIITEYDEGLNIVISAPEVNDQTVQFICWSADKDGKDVLSTNEKYPIKVINNIHIYAIYSEEKQQEQIPTVIANGVSTTGSDSSTSLVFNISRNVPEESTKYRIVESGILYSMSSSWKNKTDSQVEDSLRFSSVNPTTGNVTLKSGAKRSAETDTASSGSQTLYVNVTGHTGDFVYLRGYMIVSCSEQEEPMIIYTNVYKVSYNTASNPRIIKTRIDSNTN